MKLMKSIRGMGFVTILALIYIHMQMQIFDMAYQGKKKQREMEDLVTHNDVVAYNIMKLTSSHNLGLTLLNNSSELKFRDQDHVVEVATTRSAREDVQNISYRSAGKANSLLGFFSLRSEAEAKSTEDIRASSPNHR